jgi:hypothetical protein
LIKLVSEDAWLLLSFINNKRSRRNYITGAEPGFRTRDLKGQSRHATAGYLNKGKRLISTGYEIS